MDLKLVVFDIGGVMIEICHTWTQAREVAGFSGPAPELDRLSHSPFLDSYQQDDISLEEYCRVLGENLHITPDQALEVHKGILRREYEGLYSITEQLKAKGILTACLSNTAEIHWQEMHRADRFPAFQLLDFRMASHREKMNKPDPAIYRRMEELAGVQSNQVLFFEDTLRNVEGARAVGWRVRQIDPAAGPDWQIKEELRLCGLDISD